MVCWQCEAPVEEHEATCSVCGVVQPPAELDPFARLGFHRSASLTAADIGERRRALLHHLHPDRFAAHSPTAGQYAHALATAINDAARALRDPLDRLTLLFRLLGIDGPPLLPDPRFRTLTEEYEAALAELVGVDAHGERDRLAREIAHRFQDGYDTLAAGLEAGDLPPLLARRALGELTTLRRLLDALEALDTTPDRLGRRRT